MHIRENTNYQIGGWAYDSFISLLSNIVLLFLIFSCFGLFCGYYEWNMFEVEFSTDVHF